MMNRKGNENYYPKIKKAKWLIILSLIVIYGLVLIPVPYYISAPGSALELSPIIEVEDGYDEQGSFMLTTIAIGPGNIGRYIQAYFDPFMEVIPKELILRKNEKPEEYSKRQLEVMKESQDSAIMNAYKSLNLPIEIKYQGILVMGVVDNMPGEKVFKVGDLITKLNDQPIHTIEELFTFLNDKKPGDNVKIDFLRENKTMVDEIELVLVNENQETNSQRVGFGFYPLEKKEVVVSKPVHFHTEDIGGPSAGLMFTLEIINQLTPEDITKGYFVAGTGEIGSNGEVGQIGGAKLKVKAAVKKGAEIFFVPKDIEADDVNQKEAFEANQSLGNPLKLVPIAHIEEALEYLKNLPQKTPIQEQARPLEKAI